MEKYLKGICREHKQLRAYFQREFEVGLVEEYDRNINDFKENLMIIGFRNVCISLCMKFSRRLVAVEFVLLFVHSISFILV